MEGIAADRRIASIVSLCIMASSVAWQRASTIRPGRPHDDGRPAFVCAGAAPRRVEIGPDRTDVYRVDRPIDEAGMHWNGSRRRFSVQGVGRAYATTMGPKPRHGRPAEIARRKQGRTGGPAGSAGAKVTRRPSHRPFGLKPPARSGKERCCRRQFKQPASRPDRAPGRRSRGYQSGLPCEPRAIRLTPPGVRRPGDSRL